MGVKFDAVAWQQYCKWQQQDRKTLKRINSLITSLQRHGYESIGKVEKLRGNLSGLYSARIDAKNRLVFMFVEEDVVIISCSGHYD